MSDDLNTSVSGFEWDEPKRLANIAKHRINFLDVICLFDGRYILTEADPYAGEERFRTLGDIDGVVVLLVWTLRADRARLISARPTKQIERERYYAARKEVLDGTEN